MCTLGRGWRGRWCAGLGVDGAFTGRVWEAVKGGPGRGGCTEQAVVASGKPLSWSLLCTGQGAIATWH